MCSTSRLAIGGDIHGVCGAADGHTFFANDVWYTTDYSQCKQGISSNPSFPEIDETITRQCIGANSGSDSAVCSTTRENLSPTTGQCVPMFEMTRDEANETRTG